MRARLACLAVWIACGDGLPPPVVDAAPDDERGLVSITYLNNRGEVLSGRPVFFQDKNSTLVLSTRTDSDGRANSYMGPDGFVTLLETRGNSTFIYTYAGVGPGDVLTIDRRSSPVDFIDLNVTIVEAPGAVSYLLYDSCLSGGGNELRADQPQNSVSLFGCGDTANLLVVALFAGGSRSYLYRGNVALPPAGPIVFDGTYRAFEDSSVLVSGAPLTAERVFVSQVLAGIQLPTIFANVDLVAGAGTSLLQIPRPPGAVLATRLYLDDVPLIGIHRAATWGPASSTTAIDLLGALSMYTVRPWFDRSRQSVRWEEAPDGLGSDLVFVGIAWARPSPSSNYQWSLVSPRTTEPTIVFPILPDPSLNPSVDDAPNPFALVNLNVDGGHERVRDVFFGPWASGSPWPTDGPSGRVIYQELGFGP